ncbi:MAG TPA: cupin domain-containing protein [Burkholderiales bacterium]
MTQATAIVQIDNDRVAVTEWRFAPGAETGWHRHEYDYVVVPLMNGKLLLKDKAGDSVSELLSGKSYFREAGVEHNVINAGDGEFAFVEIQMKTCA